MQLLKYIKLCAFLLILGCKMESEELINSNLEFKDNISICPEKNICLDCSIETDKWKCEQASCTLQYSDNSGLYREEELISIDCDSEEELEGSICIAGICAGCIGFNYESTGFGVQCWIGGCSAQCTTGLGCTSSGCKSSTNS